MGGGREARRRGGRTYRQRPGHHRRRRGPDAAGALPARHRRPHRDQHRLRHHVLRRLHGVARRRVGQVVHRAGRAGGRALGDDAGGPGRRQRRDAPGPAGVPHRARPAVRLLHAGDGDGDRVAAEGEPVADRGGGPRGPRGQHLPVHRLSQHRAGGADRRRRWQRAGGGAVIPPSFTYLRASSVDEALGLAAEHGEDAKYLAGGHSLLPMMKLRLAFPEVLIDLGRITELSYIRDAGTYVAVGAMTRHHDVATSALLASDIPLLAHTAGEVGDPQIRHRGTIGGSVAHGDAASDLPATLLALDAVFVIRGPAGTRSVPAAEFFKGIFETAIEPGELLTEIQVPKPARPSAWSFQKFTKRKIDWAIVGVAVQGSSVALINMGLTPLRASAVESALASGASIADAAARAAEGTSAGSDIHASRSYREHLARVLVRRALEEAASRT